MASRTPTPNRALQDANPVISSNRLAFEEAKRAMRNDLPAHFVSAVDRMRAFMSREDAFYPEALPEYVEMLEIGIERLKVWLGMPVDRSLPLDESLRAFRTFIFELNKWEMKFRPYPALLTRLTAAFGWIFQHSKSPLVPPSPSPIIDTSNAALNRSANPTGISHSAGSALNSAPSVAASVSPTLTVHQGEQLDITMSRQVWLPNQAPITVLGDKALPHVIPPPGSQQNQLLAQAPRMAPINARPSTLPMRPDPPSQQNQLLAQAARMAPINLPVRPDPPRVPIKRQQSLPHSPLVGPNGEVGRRHNPPSVPVGTAHPTSTQPGLLGTPSSSLSFPSGARPLEAPGSAFSPTNVVDLGQGQNNKNATLRPLSLRTNAPGARTSSPVFGSLKPLTVRAPENWGLNNVSVPLKMEEEMAGENQNLNSLAVLSEASPAYIQISQPTVASHSGAAISGALKSNSTATAPPSVSSHAINAAPALTGMGASSSVPQSPLVPETAAAGSAPTEAMPPSDSMQTSASVNTAHDASMDVCTNHATTIAQSAVTSAMNTVAGSITAHTVVGLNGDRRLTDIGTGNATYRQQDGIEEGEILEWPAVSPEPGVFAAGETLPATGVRGWSGGAGGEPATNQDLIKTHVANHDLNHAGSYPHSGAGFVFVETQTQPHPVSASLHLSVQQIPDPRSRTSVSSRTMDISDDEVDELLQVKTSVSPHLKPAARELDAVQPMPDGVGLSDSTTPPAPSAPGSSVDQLTGSANIPPTEAGGKSQTEWVVAYQTGAGRSHDTGPGAVRSPTAIAKIREILTPVIVANTLRENPGTDPELIAAQITEAQLLYLASFADPLHAEAQRAGIDLREWRSQQSAEAYGDNAPPTSPDTIMSPSASPVVPMDVGTAAPGSPIAATSRNNTVGAVWDTASPSTSPSSITTRVARQASGHSDALSHPTAKSEGTGFAQTDLAANAASSTPPIAEPSIVHRTLCTITGSEGPSVVALPFELTTTEMDSTMRWARRHQDIDSESEHLSVMLRCLPKDLTVQAAGEATRDDRWPAYGHYLFLHHEVPGSTSEPLYLPLAPPVLSQTNEPVCLTALVEPGISQFQLVQIGDCSDMVFALQLCRPNPAEFEKWLKRSNDQSIRENAWRTLLERIPAQPPSPFQHLNMQSPQPRW